MLRVRRLFTFLLAMAPAVAAGQDMIFRWVDNKGGIHITDRLGDVPETYHSLYAAKLRELAERRKQAGAQSPAAKAKPKPHEPPSSGQPSLVEQELARQKEWKATVAKWRQELEEATADYEKVHTELQQAQLNPVLRLTPQVQAQIAEIQPRVDLALARLESARRMLLVDLPRKAKEEGVPPKWLL
ncbi:MAG: DUF4124 domain-containing protein [Deltaproteobacteria bacterium]|nr:DUF4124 domain-containing protein [Deltaproteobacteria bacterium]